MNKILILRSENIKDLRAKWINDYGYLDRITKKKIANPTLDHDHISGFCRGVLDRDSNQFLGKVESAFKRFLKHKGFKDSDLPLILNNLGHYLKFNQTNLQILHPQSLGVQIKRFSRLKSNQQKTILMQLGLNELEIKKTKDEKTKQYRKLVVNSENILKFN
tara:strand:- start:26215 stop:26700 length:486 start_codon:yes stop_codon:yes gene_type:complete